MPWLLRLMNALVAQVDEAALRTTPNVDVLVWATDLVGMIAAMIVAALNHRNTSGLEMFVEHPDASARDATISVSGIVASSRRRLSCPPSCS